jgi:hypothetical protein
LQNEGQRMRQKNVGGCTYVHLTITVKASKFT